MATTALTVAAMGGSAGATRRRLRPRRDVGAEVARARMVPNLGDDGGDGVMLLAFDCRSSPSRTSSSLGLHRPKTMWRPLAQRGTSDLTAVATLDSRNSCNNSCASCGNYFLPSQYIFPRLFSVGSPCSDQQNRPLCALSRYSNAQLQVFCSALGAFRPLPLPPRARCAWRGCSC